MAHLKEGASLSNESGSLGESLLGRAATAGSGARSLSEALGRTTDGATRCRATRCGAFGTELGRTGLGRTSSARSRWQSLLGRTASAGSGASAWSGPRSFSKALGGSASRGRTTRAGRGPLGEALFGRTAGRYGVRREGSLGSTTGRSHLGWGARDGRSLRRASSSLRSRRLSRGIGIGVGRVRGAGRTALELLLRGYLVCIGDVVLFLNRTLWRDEFSREFTVDTLAFSLPDAGGVLFENVDNVVLLQRQEIL